MKAYVSFSGGKDSQACLIWAAKEYSKNVEAVFCDTGNEHPVTIAHVHQVCDQLGVKLHVLKGRYDDFGDMVAKRGRFPSTKARFCTEELKIKPMVDFVLAQASDMIIIQGIRNDESRARRDAEPQCAYFKGWVEPYMITKKGRKRYNTYRKKAVLANIASYATMIVRPIISWTAQQTIDYILVNGQKPNPLYYKGFSRVGCFPCIQCKHGEIKNIIQHYPEHITKVKSWEAVMKSDRHFFPPNYIPKWAMTNKVWPSTDDVIRYIEGKNQTEAIFDEDYGPDRCVSAYHLCE